MLRQEDKVHGEIENYVDPTSSNDETKSSCIVCPICIQEIHCYSNEEKEHSNRQFQLQSCNHTFCINCLSQFCASKIIDGITKIPCCYPTRDKNGGIAPSFTEAVLPCNTLISDNNIREILTFQPSDDASDLDNNVKTDILSKYERFQFDSLHKNTSRRCPTCDHPHIFQMQPISTSSDDIRIDIEPDSKLPRRLFRAIKSWGPFEQTPIPTAPFTQSLDENKFKSSFSTKQDPPSQSINNINNQNKDSKELNANHLPNTYKSSNESIGIDVHDFKDTLPETRNNGVQLEPQIPVVKCTRCSTDFCYYHSNAHPNETCEEYEKRRQKEDQLNSAYLMEHTKSCPECHANVQKISGCNQMKCINCDTNFCWICLTIVDDGTFPAHFQWWNLRGCPNMQLHDGLQPSKCAMFMSKCLSLMQIMFIGVPSFVLTFISYLFICFCRSVRIDDSERERATQCFSFWGNCLTFILALPFTCCGCVITCFIWVLNYCFVLCAEIGKRFGIIRIDDMNRPQKNEHNLQTGEEERSLSRTIKIESVRGIDWVEEGRGSET